MENLYVVEIDSRETGNSADWSSYKESRASPVFFQEHIVQHPRMVCHTSTVARLCGVDLKLYFMKYKAGLGKYYREGGGEIGVGHALVNDPHMFRGNNGVATYLTIEPEVGLGEYVVTGKAYVVVDDGRYPLSSGQVWGLQEMVNCVMDIYDMNPENMARGKQTLETWAEAYKKRAWTPPSGLGGVDIYSPRERGT